MKMSQAIYGYTAAKKSEKLEKNKIHSYYLEFDLLLRFSCFI